MTEWATARFMEAMVDQSMSRVKGRVMTDADLDRWEKLAAEATPGPWIRGMEHECVSHICSGRAVIFEIKDSSFICDKHIENRAFVAASREAVPALVAEVRRLRPATHPHRRV